MAMVSSDVTTKPMVGQNSDDGKSANSASVLFKPPLKRPPQKRTQVGSPRMKEILDEETYTQDLENIIERDFFPDLKKIRTHLEYREALETNDVAKLRELRGKYGNRLDSSSRAMAFGGEKSPATFETPVVGVAAGITPVTPSSVNGGETIDADELETDSSDRSLSENSEKRVANRCLDSYLASNTSEDNASFGAIMDEADRKHRMKYAWLYDKEIEHAKFQEDFLALPSTEEQATDRHRVAGLDTWTYTNKNYVMYVPDGAELTAAERQALVVNRSQVMHSNTRFRWLPFNEQANREAICAAAQLQARAKEGKIGVDGKEVAPVDEPQVNGYGFVVTPSPAPGVNESPLMTWGEIEGTPYRLDGSQSPSMMSGPSFHIAAVPNRDRLAKKLAEKVCMQHREKKRIALQAVKATLASPSPLTSHVERLASMSPAVQRLASSQLCINLGDKSLRLSYTPTRTPRSSGGSEYSGTPVSLSSSSMTQQKTTTTTTPVVAAGVEEDALTRRAKGGRSTTPSSLTDDLLNLPKRSRARDFFN